MLEIKNIEVVGLQRSLLASGNAMTVGEINTKLSRYEPNIDVWGSISNRGKKLGSSKQGSGHDHFLCGIDVYLDIKYPLYWSPEAQRYHWFEIITSQSTMHRLTTVGSKNEFASMFNKYVHSDIIKLVKNRIDFYNELVNAYELGSDGYYHHKDANFKFSKTEYEETKYITFMEARSNLPSGYEMWMTVKTNYLQLKTMYSQRKNHKLKEDWGAFISMCDELPMFKELIGV